MVSEDLHLTCCVFPDLKQKYVHVVFASNKSFLLSHLVEFIMVIIVTPDTCVGDYA